MRVGLFSPNYPGVTGDGGIGTYTRALAESLVQSGHVADVITIGHESQQVLAGRVPVQVTTRRHVPVIDRLFPGASAAWSVGQSALRAVRKGQLDLYEFPNWEGLGVYFGLRRSIPLVVRLSTSSAETQAIDALPRTWQLACDIMRETIQVSLADALVTHSNAHRLTMAAELKLNPEQISVIPLGVPVVPDFVKPIIGTHDLTVVFLGRLERRKGSLDLFRAIPLVLNQVPNARFILIGPDRPHCPGGRTHREYLESEFPGLVREHVTLKGSLDDATVTKHLQTADLFVAPSLYESFGLIFLEAMRWGTAVIGTTAGGIPEIVESGKSGILVAPGDHIELAHAISTLLRNPEQRRRLGEAGRRRVEAYFSVHTMTDNNLNFYADVIARAQYKGRTR